MFDLNNRLFEYFIFYFCIVQHRSFLILNGLEKAEETMENKTIQRTLYKVLRKTGVRRDRIKLEASFNDDLKFDQVDWALFVFYLEGLFKIQLEDQEISKLSLVNDTLAIVNKKTKVEYSF